MHSSSTVCSKGDTFVLLVAGSMRCTVLVSLPSSERVDGPCDASVFAEAGATTGLDVDWDGSGGVETETGVGGGSCGAIASLL